MNELRKRAWASLAALIVVGAAPWANATVIDDFENDLLSPEWNQSNVLAVDGNDAVVTYDTTTNDGLLTYHFTTSTNNAVQTVLMRDDISLANDGDRLEVDITLFGDSATTNLLGGLVIDSATETPNVRDNLLMLIIAGNGRVIAQQNATQTNQSPIGTAPLGTMATLRMQRMSATEVALLYSLDGETFTQLGGEGFNYTVAGFNALGVIGGSARTTPTNASITFDNLRLGQAAPLPMPDLNMDGKVDIFDVAIVSNNWANTGAPGSVDGDANKDGVVDIFDVALISNNWNPGSAASVPEPTSCALAVVGLGMAMAARGARKSTLAKSARKEAR